MRGMVPLDPQDGISKVCYAVVYVPRRSRRRFAASCVDIQADRLSAIAKAKLKKKYYAAKVAGPSKSSEGQFIYYLLEWLE